MMDVEARTDEAPVEGKWRVWQPRKRGPMSKEEWRKTHPHRKRKWVRSAPAHAP